MAGRDRSWPCVVSKQRRYNESSLDESVAEACAARDPEYAVIFSSYAFLLQFLPVVWAGFMVLRRLLADSPYRATALLMWLLVSSCWFYAQWHLPDLWILLGVVAVNYVAATLVASKRARWALLTIVAINLSLLAFF